MILTVVVFLIILSILVIVHEFGHFIVGKINGIKIEEFALGLPFTKPILSKKLSDGMKLSLYPLLFGGFVKLQGEEKNINSKTSFSQKNVWQRIAVVLAGVSMNVVLAIVAFYLFLGLSGFKVLLPRLADYQFKSPNKTFVVVTYVQKNSPAEQVGLVPGDVLTNFNKLSDFQNFVKIQAGNEIKLKITDSTLSKNREVTIVPRKNPPVGQGPLGVGIDEAVILDYQTSNQKLTSGLSYTADMFIYNFKVIGSFIGQAKKSGNIEPLSDNVSGPVGIASAVGSILDLGGSQAFIQMLNLLGILSLSLAFMNVLPFPALDGGRFAFLFVEAITGKKLPAKIENIINQIGMGILLLLIVLVSFNDVSKLVSPLLPH